MVWFVNGGDYQSKDGQSWKEFAEELASDASLRDDPSDLEVYDLKFQTKAMEGSMEYESVERFQEYLSSCYHDAMWDRQAEEEDRNSNRMNRY